MLNWGRGPASTFSEVKLKLREVDISDGPSGGAEGRVEVQRNHSPVTFVVV